MMCMYMMYVRIREKNIDEIEESKTTKVSTKGGKEGKKKDSFHLDSI